MEGRQGSDYFVDGGGDTNTDKGGVVRRVLLAGGFIVISRHRLSWLLSDQLSTLINSSGDLESILIIIHDMRKPRLTKT